MLGGIGVLDIVGLLATGLRVAPWELLHQLAMPAAMSSIAAYYHVSGRSDRLARTLSATAQLFMLGLVGSIASYLLIRMGRPFVDGWLIRFDMMMGLDWPAYCHFIEGLGPWVNTVLERLYASSVAQIILVAIFLGYTDRSKRLAEFAGCFVLTAITVVVLGALLPALGAHHAYGIEDGGKASFIPEIIAAHGRQVDLLNVARVKGLVTFPSFHTAISLLLIIAMWRVGWVGWIVLVANVAVLVSVPVYGSHHFVDMLGGAVLTALAIWLWRTLLERRQIS